MWRIEWVVRSVAAVHSVLQLSLCPENVFFHFLMSETDLKSDSPLGLPETPIQGLFLRSGESLWADLVLNPPSPRAAPQLCEELPRHHPRTLCQASHLP